MNALRLAGAEARVWADGSVRVEAFGVTRTVAATSLKSTDDALALVSRMRGAMTMSEVAR